MPNLRHSRRNTVSRRIPYFVLMTVALLVAAAFVSRNSQIAPTAQAVSTTLVISQFQVAGASASDEFIELHNVSNSDFNLNGHRIVYRGATSMNDSATITSFTTDIIIPAGGYYLIAHINYDDSVAEDRTYGTVGNSGTLSGAAAGGGIAIRNGAENTGTILDSVGYGTTTNAFVETTATALPTANNSRARLLSGCQDTDNNANDFEGLTPSAPRNSATPVVTCTAPSSADLSATMTVFPRTTANIGALISWRTTVRNNGASDATGVTVTDTVPDNVTVTSISRTFPFTRSGNQITFQIGDLAAGEEASVGINARGAAAGTATNTATVAANESDPNSANNTASSSIEITAVVGVGQLFFRPGVTQGGCQNGGAVTGTIVLNGTSSGVTNVSLSDDDADNSAISSLPANVAIPAGQQSATFPITTNVVATTETATITAQTAGTTPVSQTITVRPIGITLLTLDQTSVAEGTTVNGTATLLCPASPGAIPVEVTIRLQGQPVSAGTTPTGLTPANPVVASGQQSVGFSFTAPSTAGTYIVRAATPGGASYSVTLQVGVFLD